MKYIYAITEENVDGCESDATEFISSNGPLTPNNLTILKACLDETKQKSTADGDDLDTADMVSDAITLFHDKTGLTLEFYHDPITEHLTF